MEVSYAKISGYKYELSRDVSIKTPLRGYSGGNSHVQLAPDGTLLIRATYAWDGASGAIDTDSILGPSLVHDALYQLIRIGALPLREREMVDKILRSLCHAAGMNSFREWYVFMGVRHFGELSALLPKDYDQDKLCVLNLPDEVTV